MKQVNLGIAFAILILVVATGLYWRKYDELPPIVVFFGLSSIAYMGTFTGLGMISQALGIGPVFYVSLYATQSYYGGTTVSYILVREAAKYY